MWISIHADAQTIFKRKKRQNGTSGNHSINYKIEFPLCWQYHQFFSFLFPSGLTGIKLNLVEDLPDQFGFLKERARLRLLILINDNSIERFLTVYYASMKSSQKILYMLSIFFPK